MTLSSYRLRRSAKLSLHGPRRPRLLHDHDDIVDHGQVDKLAASGDCFVSLATVLAETTQQLAAQPEKAIPELEKIILTLLYLQDNYQIYRKLTPHP